MARRFAAERRAVGRADSRRSHRPVDRPVLALLRQSAGRIREGSGPGSDHLPGILRHERNRCDALSLLRSASRSSRDGFDLLQRTDDPPARDLLVLRARQRRAGPFAGAGGAEWLCHLRLHEPTHQGIAAGDGLMVRDSQSSSAVAIGHARTARKVFESGHGIPESARGRADRVEFVGRQPWPQYIRTYHRIDIGLDPFPYNGGITTCDTLWMGVPVVTLSGRTAVGRAGRSILCNVGLADLIAARSAGVRARGRGFGQPNGPIERMAPNASPADE